MDPDQVAERLYALAPEEFTAARDAAAAAAPDAAARKAVKALRRPTAAAYAVNRLVRERGGDLDALVDLGERLRAAMGGDPAAVRRLTEQRRTLVTALVDPDLPAGVQQEVVATLEAATADPELGAAVRSGRLVKPLRYAGFGALPDLAAAVATLTIPGRSREPSPPAQAELAAARQRVLDLAGVADDAQRRYEQAAAAVAAARSQLERAEAECDQARQAAGAAHDAAERARQELGRLERS